MSGESPTKLVFKKLLKSKGAVIGSVVVIIAFLISTFAYVLIDDKTPDANLQIPELSLKKPGYETQILFRKKNRNIDQPSILKKLFFGAESQFEQIPINSYRFGAEQLEVVLKSGTTMWYDYRDIAYNLRDSSNINPVDKSTIESTHIGERTYLLGTDKFGRSVLSRLFLGIRISLLVGFIAVLISITIGIGLGSIAGYMGGKIDQAIMMLINTVWSIPTLLLVFAIVLALGKGVMIIFLAVGLTMWVEVARIVRGQVLQIKEDQFVQAAKSMGYGTYRIITKHILPNIVGPVLVIAAANFATAILIEAGLSYLGFGIQPPSPSIGSMLNENYGYVFSGRTILAIAPALTIMMLVLSFNLVGSGLRDAFDFKNK